MHKGNGDAINEFVIAPIIGEVGIAHPTSSTGFSAIIVIEIRL